ncbi:energy transducer TonB, partial [Pseudomonas aeruginosa]|nr:energy transducer TonB [Pseudomonas aeruginosa]
MATPQPVDARTQPWRETPGGDLVALGRPVRQALHLVRHN